MNASGASGSDEDARKWPMELQNTSEWVHIGSEPGGEKNPLYGLQVKPNELVSETAIPGDIHGPKERPRYNQDEWIKERNSPKPNQLPWDPGGDQEATRGNKVDSGSQNVVKGAEYEGTCTRSDGSAHVIQMNMQRRDRPGGHLSDEVRLGAIGSDWEHRNYGEGARDDERRCRMVGTTNGARCNLKWIETRPLAGTRVHQYDWYNRNTTNIPRLSTAPEVFTLLFLFPFTILDLLAFEGECWNWDKQ